MRHFKFLIFPAILSVLAASCANQSAPTESTTTTESDAMYDSTTEAPAEMDHAQGAPAPDTALQMDPGSGTLDPPKPPGR